MQKVKAVVLDKWVIHRLTACGTLSRRKGSQFCFFVGEKRWIVVKIMVTEGAVCVSFPLATVCAMPSIPHDCYLVTIFYGLVEHRSHHAADTSVAMLGHKGLFVPGVLGPLQHPTLRGCCRLSFLNDSAVFSNAKSVGDDDGSTLEGNVGTGARCRLYRRNIATKSLLMLLVDSHIS